MRRATVVSTMKLVSYKRSASWGAAPRSAGALSAHCHARWLQCATSRVFPIHFEAEFMINTLARTVTLLALAAAGAAHAASPKEEMDHVKSVIASRFPDVPIEAVLPSPIPGIYEVDTATDIVYADASGEYIFSGSLMAKIGRAHV